jgi:sugar lactone lactonase YvrE/predicted alpha/beta superfamily hydrolase
MQNHLVQNPRLIRLPALTSLTFFALMIYCVFVTFANVTVAADDYFLGPDSQVKPDVPQGELKSYTWDKSRIYPGTRREYQVYIPKQYDPSKPAALIVLQDGGGYANRNGAWRVPTVFDNLIHAGEMPVTIGVFINPGVTPSGSDAAQDRFNRSLEYDAVSDRYARFLVEEILPEVAKEFSITEDPNLRAIGGASSGAIAAFGVAWHRPDQFRRVFSTIGTYVGLRGGDVYPTLIRKTEPKPIKVFLQDGSGDLNIYGGDWWIANQAMLSAFRYAGYDVNHVWGDGGHNSKQGAAIFPDAMRWLWKDADQVIEPKISERHGLANVLVPGKTWELISEGHQFAEGPAVSPSGDVYFTNVPAGEIWKITDGTKATLFMKDMPGASGLMFDAAGNLYVALSRKQQIVKVDPKGIQTVLANEIACNDITVANGRVYITEPRKNRIMMVSTEAGVSGSADISAEVAAEKIDGDGIDSPNGLITTPDNRFLLVSDSRGMYVWSYLIGDDGKLVHGQPYHHVHAPVDETLTGADGATMTDNGFLYLATKMGVQVFDQPGRCHGIIPLPGNSVATNVVLAGPEMNVLYATTTDGKVFRRELKVRGVAPWQSPVKPEKPRL